MYDKIHYKLKKIKKKKKKTRTRLPMQGMLQTWFIHLGGEDPLEKGMVTHSSMLAWRIPWTEEPAGLQSMG